MLTTVKYKSFLFLGKPIIFSGEYWGRTGVLLPARTRLRKETTDNRIQKSTPSNKKSSYETSQPPDFTSGPTWARTRDHLIMSQSPYGLI